MTTSPPPSHPPPRVGSSDHEEGEVPSAVALPDPGSMGDGEYGGAVAPSSDAIHDKGGMPELDPIDAIVCLHIGLQESDEEEAELEALAASYPFRKRPHPLEEAYLAHRTVLERYQPDPGHRARVRTEAFSEAYVARRAVYFQSVERLEQHLLDRYAAKRAERPMNVALLSVVAYFRYHYLSRRIDVEGLGKTVNILVGKLRDRTLADWAAGQLGVEPTVYDPGRGRRVIDPAVRAKMEAGVPLWRTDETMHDLKEAWARERIEELVGLTFDTAILAEPDDPARTEHDPWAWYRSEYVYPELIDVRGWLGLRQISRVDGTAYYGGR